MSTTLVVCPECSSPVAPGRLSCQSCGTLLASVVGPQRRPAISMATAALPEIDEDRPLAAFMPSEPAPEPPNRWRPPAPKARPPAADALQARIGAGQGSLRAETGVAGPAPEQTSIFGAPPNAAPPILQDWADPSAGPAGTASGVGGSGHDAGSVPGAYLAPSASYMAPAPRPAATPAPFAGPRLLPHSPGLARPPRRSRLRRPPGRRSRLDPRRPSAMVRSPDSGDQTPRPTTPCAPCPIGWS